MNHPYTEEEIIRFIRGELVGEELNAFEKEMNSNKFLENEVSDIRLSLSAIDADGKQLLVQRFRNLERRNVIKKWVTILLAIISLLIIVFAIKYQFFKSEPIEMKVLYADNFEKYRPPVSMRNDENLKADWSSAVNAYVADDYEKAFSLFNAYCSLDNQEACFYAVLSALYGKENNYQTTKKVLKEDSPYLSILLWNEALHFLNRDMKNEAIVIFEELIKREDYKKNEALEILGQLRKTN